MRGGRSPGCSFWDLGHGLGFRVRGFGFRLSDARRYSDDARTGVVLMSGHAQLVQKCSSRRRVWRLLRDFEVVEYHSKTPL